MSEPDVEVAKWFDDIVVRTAGEHDVSALPYAEQVVYYVVSVRTEADINGFCSVFEQLLTDESGVAFLARALRQLDEGELADAFVAIQHLLRQAGYFEDPTREFHGLPFEALQSFRELERRVLLGDRLWDLDAKLLELRARP